MFDELLCSLLVCFFSSDLLFSSSSGLELIIISFSVVQRSHLFVTLLYGLALQMIVHLILKSFLLSRSCQMYLDSSVLCYSCGYCGGMNVCDV